MNTTRRGQNFGSLVPGNFECGSGEGRSDSTNRRTVSRMRDMTQRRETSMTTAHDGKGTNIRETGYKSGPAQVFPKIT